MEERENGLIVVTASCDIDVFVTKREKRGLVYLSIVKKLGTITKGSELILHTQEVGVMAVEGESFAVMRVEEVSTGICGNAKLCEIRNY